MICLIDSRLGQSCTRNGLDPRDYTGLLLKLFLSRPYKVRYMETEEMEPRICSKAEDVV
jgi:hypothetical protein